jgi:hypothetical protein
MASAMFAVAMEMIMSGRSQMRFDGTATPLMYAPIAFTHYRRAQ